MPPYDHAQRRRATRRQRQTGCFVYIPGEELERTGVFRAGGELPYYRVWAAPGRGRVMVSLYPEP